jgi:hypothetical protein
MKALGEWRAAINWHLSVLIFGSLAATLLLTIPFLFVYCIIYGIPPPAPSWLTMRLLQLAQAGVISTAGGYLALRYFRNRFDITYSQMREPMTVLAVAVPALCVLTVFLVSIPKYGVTQLLTVSAALIFGTFTLLFIAGSFHFARKLTELANYESKRLAAGDMAGEIYEADLFPVTGDKRDKSKGHARYTLYRSGDSKFEVELYPSFDMNTDEQVTFYHDDFAVCGMPINGFAVFGIPICKLTSGLTLLSRDSHFLKPSAGDIAEITQMICKEHVVVLKGQFQRR